MKFNWHPSRVCFLDYETQSEQELDTVSKYFAHPSTRTLTCVVKKDGQVYKFGPYLDAEAKQRLAAVTEGCTIIAHNAPFDYAAWQHDGMPDRLWFDTLRCARAAGLPGKLEQLGQIIAGQGKDKNGKLLIELLCKIKPGKVPAIGAAHQLLLAYNEQDVQLLEQIYERVHAFVEPAVMDVDQVINERGVPIDRQLLETLSSLFAINASEAAKRFDGLAKDVSPSSPKQVVSWLKEQGFNVPGVNKFVYKNLLADPSSFFVGDSDMDAAFEVVRDALDARKEIVRVGKGKVEAAKETVEEDGRIREQFVYWGAGPGRWSGRRLQLHNLPQARHDVDLHELCKDLTYSRCVAAAQAATERARAKSENAVAVTDILNSLIRHLVRADNLNTADYGAVELRCVFWMADDPQGLATLRDPKRSIYLDMGEKVFGFPITKADYERYMFSKALVLGCGYGMSGNKFAWLCKIRNIRTSTLQEAGMDAKEAVKVFRKTYSAIPALWRSLNEATHLAVNGVSNEAGRCKFYMSNRDLVMQLPSDRCIRYRNARIEMLVPGYCKLYGMPEVRVPTVVYDSPRGHTDFLYGSKVCENLAQGICRDLLADALVCSEQEGLNPILHVHDEVGLECEPSKLNKLLELMSAGPAWSKGFPILAEGFSSPVWTKQAKVSAKALGGTVL
jgi:DNA polymerase